MRSRIASIVRWSAAVFLLGAALYLVFAEGWKDLTLGRFHRKAETMFSESNGVTEARIYLLEGSPGQMPSGKFSVMPINGTQDSYGTVSLSGSHLEAFLDLWRHQQPSFYSQAMCFEPVYGFTLYKGAEVVTETKLCWECSGFFVPVWPFMGGEYGFDSRSKTAKELLAFCDSRLPYPKPPEEKSTK